MSAKIKLYVKGSPRGAFLKLQGRSGAIYDTAHFNDKSQAHETKEFDLADFTHRILPDVEKFPSQLRWWPVVTVEAEGEEVTRLNDELEAAKARILELEAAQTNAPDVFAGLAGHPDPVGTDGVIGPAGVPKPLTELNYRELRALCKQRDDIVLPTSGVTREVMIGLLTTPPEPVHS